MRRAVLAALLCLALPAWAVDILLLHVNDVYQLGSADGVGGLARLQTLHHQLRAAEGNRLLLTFGGDTLSPSILSSEFKGAPLIAAWNAIGIDVAVLGNHEFDYGPEVLRMRLKESGFPWLAGNVVEGDGLLPGTAATLVKEIAGLRIGFLGVVTANTPKVSRPGKDVKFLDPVTTANQLADHLRRESRADAVVALTHLDLEDDRRLARDGKVDLILGGHDHHVVTEVTAGRPILKAGADAREAILVRLHFDDASRKLQPVEWRLLPVNTGEDREISALAHRYDEALQEALKAPIGETETPLDARTNAVRSNESAAGDLVADAFREALAADLAIVNGGALRSNAIIPPGPLSKLDVKKLLPFGNRVLKLAVSGAELQALLSDLGDQLANGPVGSFPQVAGLKISFEHDRPPGKRLADARLESGGDIEAEKTYSLAVSDFLAAGNGGYDRLKALPRLVVEDAGPIETEAVMAYLARHPRLRYTGQGRVVVK